MDLYSAHGGWQNLSQALSQCIVSPFDFSNLMGEGYFSVVLM
jgi:hypothetical protein